MRDFIVRFMKNFRDGLLEDLKRLGLAGLFLMLYAMFVIAIMGPTITE